MNLMQAFRSLPWPTRALMRTANYDPGVNNGEITYADASKYLLSGGLILIAAFFLALTLSADISLFLLPEAKGVGRAAIIAAMLAPLLVITWFFERSLVCSLPNVMTGPDRIRALIQRGSITLGSALLSTVTFLLIVYEPQLDMRNQQEHLTRVGNSYDQLVVGTGLAAAGLALEQSETEAKRLNELLVAQAPTAELSTLLAASNACREQEDGLQKQLSPRIAAWLTERIGLNPEDSRYAELSQDLTHAWTRLANKKAECKALAQRFTQAREEYTKGVKRSLEQVNSDAAQQREKRRVAQKQVSAEMAVVTVRSQEVARPHLSSRADALPALLRESSGAAMIGLLWFVVIASFELGAVLSKLGRPTVYQMQAQQRDETLQTVAHELTTRLKAEQRASVDYWNTVAGQAMALERIANREKEVQFSEKIRSRARMAGVTAEAYVESVRQTDAKAYEDPEIQSAAQNLRADLSALHAASRASTNDKPPAV